MRICITGGAGFIGHHTVSLLKSAGHDILVVDNLSSGNAENLPKGVALEIEDVLEDSGSLAIRKFSPEAVLHLAAKVTIRGSVDNISEDARQNFLATATVLETAIRAGARRFVLASSMAVYADTDTPFPVPEDWRKKPRSPYGISKLSSEDLVHLIGERTGLSTLALRFFNTYGIGQTPSPYVGVITIFLEQILSGEQPVIYGDGEQCRDFVHVGDVARSCLLALESNITGRSVNIGTGMGTTVNQIAHMLLNILGSSVTPRYVESRPEELRNSVADIRLARGLLGFHPEGDLKRKLNELISYRIGAEENEFPDQVRPPRRKPG